MNRLSPLRVNLDTCFELNLNYVKDQTKKSPNIPFMQNTSSFSNQFELIGFFINFIRFETCQLVLALLKD